MLFVAKFNIESAGGLGGGDVNAGPQQVVPGWLSSGVVNEDDGQIIDCLEHERHR
jgi:hypothetical protein